MLVLAAPAGIVLPVLSVVVAVPPPIVILPPPVVCVVLPLAVLIVSESPNVIPPAVVLPAELLQSMRDPLLVCRLVLAATVIAPEAFKSIAAPDKPLVKLLLSLILPPYTVMGPIILMARPMVTSAVLVVLPIVKLLSELPNVQPAVENAPLKLEAADSIRKPPSPLIDELDEVGALFDMTKVPAERVVIPV